MQISVARPEKKMETFVLQIWGLRSSCIDKRQKQTRPFADSVGPGPEKKSGGVFVVNVEVSQPFYSQASTKKHVDLRLAGAPLGPLAWPKFAN